MTPQQKKDYYYRNHKTHWQAGTTGINPKFFGQDEGSSRIVKVKGNITKNNLKAADTDYYHPTIKPNRHYINPFSMTENFLYKKPVQQVIFKEEVKEDPIVKPIIPIEQPQPPIPSIPPVPPTGYPGIMPVYDTDELPMYATPDPGAEWVNQTERYIDWDANRIPYRLPRFRQPGHGGDLIKPGKRRYIPIPGIETRNSAYIQREGETTEEYGQGGTIHFEPSEYGSDAREHYDDGGKIYTYSKRPGSYYQKTEDGWLINNSSTGGKYVPIDDPTGERAALLSKYAKPQPGINKVYADPLSRNSETTQAVAAKTTPQTQEQRDNIEEVKRVNRQRQSDLNKALQLEGYTPEQATSIIGSYGSDWPTLETAKARDIQIMNKTAADIQAGINPSSMQSFTPKEEQSTLGRVRDIAFNPFTSAGYALRGQDIPEYMGEKIDNGTLGYWSNGQFVEGRNALDTVTDTATPIGWAHSAYNIANKATNNKSGDFWTEENAWDALNTVPGIGLAAKGMKYASLPSRLSIVPKSNATNLAVDAGSIAREPYYAPQRPNLLHLGVSPEQQELLNLQQVNNTTMLSSVAPAKKLKLYGEDYRSPAGLPSYMEPSLYSQEEMARRMTPYQQALMRINQTEKAADRVIKRTTDDKVYYDAEGNVLKTPEDNLARGGFLHKYPFGGDLAGEPVPPVQPTTPPDTNPANPTAVNAAGVQDFYTNWYSKRTLPFAEIGNKQYEKVMRSVLPAYNPQSPLLNDITQKAVPYEVQPMIEGDPSATGALVYNKQGIPEKIQLKESILSNPRELDSTLVHEEHTRIMNPYADKVLPAEQMIINPSIKTFEEGWGNLKGNAADAAGEYYDYITDPQGGNIQSMLFEVRKSKNLQPDQVITDQDIESWKQEAEQSGALDPNNANYDNALYNLFKLGKDNASIKNLFNYIASNKTQQPNAMSGSMNNMG